jgi:hypothetical protein
VLRQVDPVTVVCGAVVLLGFFALWLLKWTERRLWRGFVEQSGDSPCPETKAPTAPTGQASSLDRPKKKWRPREWQDGEDVPWTPYREWFYESDWRWQDCRARFLQIWEEQCEPVCMRPGCGRDVSSPKVRNVDHIHPVRFYWTRRYDLNNLQVLCWRCNKLKKSWDCSDYRPEHFKVYMASIAVQRNA